MIAGRYLRARRSEGFISVVAWFSLVGITLGVMTLIVVTSVMNGVKEEITEQILGIDGHVTIQGRYADLPDTISLIDELPKQEGIEAVIPKVKGQVMVTSPGQARGAQVLALRAQDMMYKPRLEESLVSGDYKAFLLGEGVIVGQRLAEALRIKTGDMITLVSPQGRATFAGVVPRVKAYPVVATFELGMFAYDSGVIVMPMKKAQIFFKKKSTYTQLEVITDNPFAATQYSAKLTEELGSNYYIYDWIRSSQSIFSALQIQQNVMLLVLALIVIVAAFNIISSLIMLVRMKRRDIAVMRTMGASKHAIEHIFVVTGTMIGVVGTLLGVVLGALISTQIETIQAWVKEATGSELFVAKIYFLNHLPAKVEWMDVAIIMFASIVLAFLAALYPARRAAKLDPAEVLRYE
jgi:lipoprotein-releasing system permease protein